MRPISPHDRFFSSLNQVEKRLSSEKDPNKTFISSPSSISFASPLYLSSPIEAQDNFNNDKEDEDEDEEEEEDDEIDSLISFLGLSINKDDDGGGLGSCHCSGGGFYRKAVGIKGPICREEMGRIDGWIEHYRRERREPARLAHLLLAKAVSLREGDDEFGGIEFPETVEEFLEHDPPPFDKG